jgi:hypothetical protein
MKTLTISSVAVMVGLMLVGSATAEEQKLKFRVVMREVGGSMMDVAGLKGHAMGAAKYAGFAVFEDGRLAYKKVVSITDGVGETGSYNGYSTYMFQNGDVLVVRFKGGWSPDSNGGDYEVVSGTGAYEGATGTGRFDAVKNPWKDADLYEGTISVKLPDR